MTDTNSVLATLSAAAYRVGRSIQNRIGVPDGVEPLPGDLGYRSFSNTGLEPWQASNCTIGAEITALPQGHRRMNIPRGARVSALLTAILPLAACGSDNLNWTEDVVLPDGRTVTLTRHQEFKGPHELGQPPTTSAYWFEFEEPVTNERVRWENDRTLTTISLSINDNIPELLTKTNYDGIFRYKCPDPPYLAFQFVNKGWVQIPLTSLTHKVLPVNMTSPGSDLREGLTSDSHLSVAEVQRVLPYQRRGKVVDLSTLTQQTFGVRCRPPFNYMMRDSGASHD